MALTEKNFLDYDGLTQYDTLIKSLIPQPDGTTITINENGQWCSHAANVTEVDEESEVLSIYNLETTPGVSGETMVF